MKSQYSENTFEGGMNKDLSARVLPKNSYNFGRNIMLSNDESNMVASGMESSSLVDTVKEYLTTPELKAEILTSVEGNLKLTTGTTVPVVVMFFKYDVGGKAQLDIFALDRDKNKYQLIKDIVDKGNWDEVQNISAQVFTESDHDFIYFTDGNNPVYKLPLILKNELYNPLAGDYSLAEITLSGSVDGWGRGITIQDVLDGTGNLLSGMYSFTGRFFKETSNLRSPLMPWTVQVAIHSGAETGILGYINKKTIRIQVGITPEIANNYSHFQLYSLEKVRGLEFYGRANVATLYEITQADIDLGYLFIDFDTNDRINEIDISQLVIAKANIQSSKTLNIKDNRLFLGNVGYSEFTYLGTGPGILESDFIIKDNTAVDHTAEGLTHKGYFRGETYRFGIVYFDKYGNTSPVNVLFNVDSTDDFTFPSRFATKLNPFFINSFVNIGLNITVAGASPQAVGFTIVRAKRKGGLLFQSPVQRMWSVEQAQAVGDYPILDNTGVSYNAQPSSADRWCVQANPLILDRQNYLRIPTAEVEPFPSSRGFEEGYLSNVFSKNSMIYDPKWMYFDKIRSLNNKILKTEDAVIYIGNTTGSIYVENTPTADSSSAGNGYETSLGVSIYTQSIDQYYSNTATGLPTTAPATDYLNTNSKITSSLAVDFASEKQITSTGEYYGGYDGLQPTGLTEGGILISSKGNIISTDTITKAMHFGLRADPTLVTPVPPEFPISTFLIEKVLFSPQPVGGSTITGNTYSVASQTVYIDNDSLMFAHEIASVKDFEGIDRYGSEDSSYEYISTGTNYFYTDLEIVDLKAGTDIATNVNIWGGDCVISRHTFEIQKSNFANTLDYGDSVEVLWGKDFKEIPATAESTVSRTVSVKSNPVLVSVMLESEENGELASISPYKKVDDNYINTDPDLSGANLAYNLSPDFSQENDSKVFVIESQISRLSEFFPSRIAFSNGKIFNSIIEGFDQYNILDFYDMNGDDGEISSLKILNDRMYCFQEEAISYIPVNKGIIETADGVAMSLSTGAVITNPLKNSNFYGAVNENSIVDTGDSLIFHDRRNRYLVEFNGENFQVLSDKGMSSFFYDRAEVEYIADGSGAIFDERIEYYRNRLAYDSKRNEVILYYQHYRYQGASMDELLYPIVYSKRYGVWASDINAPNGVDYIFEIKRFFIDLESNQLYNLSAESVIDPTFPGAVTDQSVIRLFNEYIGTSSNSTLVFNNTNSSGIKFVSNPSNGNVVTFDEFIIYKDGSPMVSIEGSVVNNSIVATTPIIDLSTNPGREGLIRVNQLRENITPAPRLRGQYANIDIDLGSERPLDISRVLTKYRSSKREIISNGKR